MIEYLNWDSNFFNKKIGKIEISSQKNRTDNHFLEDILKRADYDLIYFFMDIRLNINDYIYSYSFKPFLVDTQVYLKINMPLKIKLLRYELITKDNLPSNVKIEDLYKISDEIAPFSRFSYDSKISKKKVIELYRKFIENSLSGSFGEGLILDTRTNGEIIGLLSVGNIGNVGKEIVIGVRKSHRGKGSGRRLFNKSLNYWKDRGVQEVKTIVSARNIDSLNFHLKLGFNIVKINNVYHLWLKD